VLIRIEELEDFQFRDWHRKNTKALMLKFLAWLDIIPAPYDIIISHPVEGYFSSL
jgi:hypothetical protein